MDRRTLDVSGMSCSGCEETVEDALRDVDGVESATADRESDTVDVVASADVPDDELVAAVDDAGYDAAA